MTYYLIWHEELEYYLHIQSFYVDKLESRNPSASRRESEIALHARTSTDLLTPGKNQESANDLSHQQSLSRYLRGLFSRIAKARKQPRKDKVSYRLNIASVW